jgi:hypothetical protein
MFFVFLSGSRTWAATGAWRRRVFGSIQTRPGVESLRRMPAEPAMTPNDFRRIALSLEGAEESSHMGNPDFRVGGRIFATLASARQGYGNLMLTPEQQNSFVQELPGMFLPVKGGWGRMGATHILLAVANKDVLTGALQTAWKLRVEKNKKSPQKNPASAKKVRAGQNLQKPAKKR